MIESVALTPHPDLKMTALTSAIWSRVSIPSTPRWSALRLVTTETSSYDADAAAQDSHRSSVTFAAGRAKYRVRPVEEAQLDQRTGVGCFGHRGSGAGGVQAAVHVDHFSGGLGEEVAE